MIKLAPEISQALGASPFHTLMHLQGEVFRQQGRRETLRVLIDAKPYYLKRYQHEWIGCGAKREWEALRVCQTLGVPAPKLMGFGARGYESFVLMEAVEPAISLEEVKLTAAEKQRLIVQVAKIASTLHQQGYYHRDFYLCHFLWDKETDDVTLIDLHRLFKPHVLKQHYLEKDLSALLFSSLDLPITQRDVLRFLKHYFNLPLSVILKTQGKMLLQCEKKAIALYKKAFHHEPRHVDWVSQHSDWPLKTGHFYHTYELGDHVFQSDACLRVLGRRRMVLSGWLNKQHVVVKFFTLPRDAARECEGMRLLGMTPDVRDYAHGRVIVSPYMEGHAPETLTTDLLACVADLHQRDMIQTDPHLDNFRVTAQGMRVLDPASIQKTAVDVKKWDNLALLVAQWPQVQDKQHLDLLPEYCRLRGLAYSDALKRAFIARLERVRAHSLKKWLAKTCRNASDFYVKSRMSLRVFSKRAFANVYAQTLLRFPDSYFHSGADFLKQGRSNTVIRAQIGEQDVVIKRYNLKSALHFFKLFLRGSKAKRAWIHAQLCRALGIPTPEPLAMIEKRRCFIPLTSYLVTVYAPGERLDRITPESLSMETWEKMAGMIREIFDLFAAVHCVHGDLKASNWIWDGNKIQLIDLDSVTLLPNATAFQRAHAEDKARFLENFDVTHPLRAML